MTPMIRILKKTLRGLLLGLLCAAAWHAEAHGAPTVQSVDLGAGGAALRIGLSERADFKALQLDAREVMVAFKAADLASPAAGSHSGAGLVKRFSLETLPDRVVSLMIDTTRDIRDVQAEWEGDTATLLVRLLTSEAVTSEIPVKHRKFKKEALGKKTDGETGAVDTPEPSGEFDQEVPGQETPRAATPEAPQTASVAISSEQPAGAEPKLPDALSGDVTLSSLAGEASISPEAEGLVTAAAEMSRSKCASSSAFGDALELYNRNEWKKAFTLLDKRIDPAASGACQADLYYLRAFSAFKMNTAGSEELYLDAVSYFQDALSYYPDSSYAPFAMLVLASIYDEIDSNSEAKGYFKLLLKTYADHPIASDALLGLGNLYAKDGRQDLAVSTYRQYLNEYPQSPRLTEVWAALGKSLYELGESVESLEILSRVLEKDPGRVYEDAELLIDIGMLNNQLGDFAGAREAMIKAVNLYPDNEAVPLLLAHIGDTLREEGREDQAKKVYELVMEAYPDTDGYIVSAVRYAGMFPDRYTKEAKYREVIERFPDHVMTKLAVIRLANLQCQAEKYSAGIETLRDLMSDCPKELKSDAENVMSLCFDGYFRQLADRDDSLAIITAYEKDKTLIDRFDNPDIFEIVGEGFYDAKFYTQAEALLQDAYKVSSAESRPASLYYRLAVTLQELGKDMQAREMFHAYFRKLPENETDPDAYLRMGQLLADEESWEAALAFVENGLKKSESNIQKAAFLMLQADVRKGMGQETTVPDLLIRAVNLMASSPEASNEQLIQAYRRLGEVYMDLSDFEKASDAFTMALNFSGVSRPPDLLFLLAESDYKAGNPDAARAVLSEIIGSGNDFWARMAEEQLRSIELEEKLGLRGEGQ